jgi:hypothetical protein
MHCPYWGFHCWIMMPKLVAVCPTVFCTDTRIIRLAAWLPTRSILFTLLLSTASLTELRTLEAFAKKLTKPSLNPNHHWPHWGFLRRKYYIFIISGITRKWWDHPSAKEEVTEYQSCQNPRISPYLFLLVLVLLLCVCVCVCVCFSLSLSCLLPILLPWSKLWQNFLSDPFCPGGMIAIGGWSGQGLWI